MQLLLRAIPTYQGRCRNAVLVIIATMLSWSSQAGAQAVDGTAEPLPPAPVEAPAPEPVVEPAPVAPAPEPPAPVDQPETVVPAPAPPVTAETVEPQPGVTNPVPSPSTPEITPTATSPPTVAPTAAASPTVAPTPTPVPMTISWSQPEPVLCTAIAGNAQSLALGDTATWRCQTSIAAEVTGDGPNDLHLLWQISAKYAGDDVRLSLPAGSTVVIQTPDPVPGGTNELVTYRTNWADGQSLTFDVTVTRTSCVAEESMLVLNASVEVKTVDASVQVARSGEDPLDTQLTSVAAANGEPTVRFDGPVAFESRSASTMGLDSPISHGTADLVVEGAWNSCSTWTLNLSGTVSVPTDAPAQLRVVSISNEPVPGNVCDLQTACDLLVLPETGNAAVPLRYTIGLELHLHELTPAGDFGIDLQTRIHGIERQP